MKRIIKDVFLIIVFVLFYMIGGILLSYRRQPRISQEYQSGFHVQDFYSDSASCDRACVIEDNEEALLERLKMIERAKDRVILSTFEFRADESGKDVLAALLAAAQRGVNVKVLADGATALVRMYGNEYFQALAAAENAEIKIYNKLNLLAPWKSMGRLHDKYLIVDDDLYLLGGRNTYDYFLGNNGYKNYDRDVLVYTTAPEREESSIHQLEQYFKSIWKLKENSLYGVSDPSKTLSAQKELEERYRLLKAEYPELTGETNYEEKTFEANRITLLSNPTHVYAKEPTIFYSLTELMKHSEGDISIHTPYIICNEWMYDSFREICERNPHTVLLTNSAANNGNPFGASDYLKNKGRLLDTGLTIYEYEGGVSYHGKSISIGDRLSVIGSFNMDMRSVYLDTELMLVIDSEGVNRQLRENMRTYEKASVKVLDQDRYEIPENVKRQELSAEKKRNIHILNLFNGFRFLM